MALNPIERVRVILDLIKDGIVTDESPYTDNTIDRMGAATAAPYLNDVWGYQTPDIESPTNPQKARHFINMIRRHIRLMRVERQASLDAAVAQRAARAATGAQADADIGTDETV